jgi:predicted dehydrogenase
MSSAQSPLEVAVIGVGRMGHHHARIYAGMGQADLVAVVDHDLERARSVAADYGCKAYATTEQLLSAHPQLAAATVSVPTLLHPQVAEQLLPRGIACLVEKPLAATVEQARALVALASEHGAVLQVGHTERFNPVVRAVTAMGLRPRFIDVHRVSPMTFRSLDVGVVMDMMIHDLDIVLTLVDEPVAKVDATGVAVLGEHEDIADARLVFESGCVANIGASRLALKTERKLHLISEEAYVSVDYQTGRGMAIRRSANASALAKVRQQLSEGADLSSLSYLDLINVEQLDMDTSAGHDAVDPLTAQLTSFLAAVRSGSAPIVDGAAGSAAVELAQRIVAAIGAHRWAGVEGGKV